MKRINLYSILLFFVLTSPFHATVIAEEMTRELNGGQITYHYSSGRAYNVKFEEQGISYRYLTGTKPEAW